MSFVDFARAHGVEIDPAHLYPSDKIRRCGTTAKPRSQNGAFFWDGHRGWVQDWSGDSRVVWYNDPHAKPWSDAEKTAWAAKRASAAALQEKRYKAAGLEAEEILKRASMKSHAYLDLKGFPDEKGFVIDDFLFIPMRNVVTNDLQGFQSIRWLPVDRKYEKKMLTGMKAKNAVYWMGDRQAQEIWLVEGYATGLSVRKALRSVGNQAAVVVTFSAMNLVQVAPQIGGRRFVFADNDESHTGQKAAEETGLPWVMAEETGWDANDLHLRKGLFSVVAKIMESKTWKKN